MQMSKRALNKRVRAILLTQEGELLFIKRVKPNGKPPYWVAPGGGVEAEDASLLSALERELIEELGARAEVVRVAFVLHHEKKNRLLEEHFFICHLRDLDLTLRHGPEFDRPEKGQYLPDRIPLEPEAIAALDFRTPELADWLLANLGTLRQIHLHTAA
jgi:8-oxo-dGTP pyrophosphatase MutT (NUDIX family)